jgi:hypothetical protein
VTKVGDLAGSGSRFGPQRLAQFATRRPRRVLLPGWLSWLPNVQVEGPRPAPLQPAVLVRQYTSDGVLTETSPAPPEPPVATSKES